MSADTVSLVANARQVLAYISSALPAPNRGPPSGCSHSPTIIGLTGLQGSGKSTWATALVSLLREEHGLNAITVSLDDFYKDHDGLVRLRESDPANKLFRTRGQPGTHDTELAESFFVTARRQNDGGAGLLHIPSFDKSKFNGEGDRAPEGAWPTVELPVDVVVFEGWCVGFKSVSDSILRQKYEHATQQRAKRFSTIADKREHTQYSTETLGDHKLDHLLCLNKKLAKYNATFMGSQHFDCFIHLDTDDLQNVYTWRLDQEDALRRRTGGQGMTQQAVIDFVAGYMPAYELYLEDLRQGIFDQGEKNEGRIQVRVCLDLTRQVVDCRRI